MGELVRHGLNGGSISAGGADIDGWDPVGRQPPIHMSLKFPWAGSVGRAFSRFVARIAAFVFPDLHDEDDFNH